jgi:hypothetical protein
MRWPKQIEKTTEGRGREEEKKPERKKRKKTSKTNIQNKYPPYDRS